MNDHPARPAFTTLTVLMLAAAAVSSVAIAFISIVVLLRANNDAEADARAARHEVADLQLAAQCRSTVAAAAQVAIIDYIVALSQGGDVTGALTAAEDARRRAQEVATLETCE